MCAGKGKEEQKWGEGTSDKMPPPLPASKICRPNNGFVCSGDGWSCFSTNEFVIHGTLKALRAWRAWNSPVSFHQVCDSFWNFSRSSSSIVLWAIGRAWFECHLLFWLPNLFKINYIICDKLLKKKFNTVYSPKGQFLTGLRFGLARYFDWHLHWLRTILHNDMS